VKPTGGFLPSAPGVFRAEVMAEAHASGLRFSHLTGQRAEYPQVVEKNVTGWLSAHPSVNRLAEAVLKCKITKTFCIGLYLAGNSLFSWEQATAVAMLQGIEQTKETDMITRWK